MPGLISTLCMTSRLFAALFFGREQVEVDRHSHRKIAGAVGVELVARPAGRAFGHELRLEAAGLRIERYLVEVDYAVEQARRADEFVERLALVILLGEAVRRIRCAERGDHRGAEYAHLRPLRANAADDLLHAVLCFLQRSVAVLAEIVDPFEPDHGAHAGELEHVALDALYRRRPARERFLWAVVRRPCDLIAADSGIDHRGAVATHGLQPP